MTAITTNGEALANLRNCRNGRQLMTTVSGAALMLILTPVAALAQDQGIEQIVVSGTRVVRDGYNAPTPVTVVGAEQIQQSAEPNIFVAVDQLPMMAGSPNVSGGASSGLSGLSSFNMRGLGSNRTLVLLDGERVIAAANTGITDASQFPQGLIQRVDVVTGGASASWGSDAVAGVVNVVLDKKFEGLKGNLEIGETTYGDDKQALAQLTGGFEFAGGKGHFEASGEGALSAGLGGANLRPWYTATKLLQNSIAATPAGYPDFWVAPRITNVQFAPGGLITSQGTSLSKAIVGVSFGAGATPFNFQFGTSPYPGVTSVGYGTIGGNQSSDLGYGTDLDVAYNRATFYSRVSYDLTPSINVFATVNWGEVFTHQYSSGSQWKAATLTIQCDNAFLPASIAAQCGGAGHSFGFGTTDPALTNSAVVTNRTMRRFVVGGDGAFSVFGTDWTFDTYFQHGEADIFNNIPNLTLTPYYNAAIDAVVASNGAIVCRSAVAQALGCVPLDVIGTGLVTKDANNWVEANGGQGAWRTTTERQEAASFSVNGAPFSDWAGPISVAAGVEYREEAFTQANDPYSSGNGGNPLLDPNGSNWWIGNFHSGQGNYHVAELFNEDVIPLLKNSAFGSADFTMAGRATGYSSAGYISTWKLGVTWDTPLNGVRIRALQSRDVRAPTLADLFAGPTVLLSTLTDDFPPQQGKSISVLQNQTGNTHLAPEKGATTEVGVVYQPDWFPGFSTSVDYYRIGVKGAIAALTLQQEMDLCFQGNAAQCALISPTPTLTNGVVPTQITLSSINLQSVVTDGFDIEASYRASLGDLIAGIPGNISLRSVMTHVSKFITYGGLANQIPVETAGQNGTGGSIPTYRWLGTVAYDNDYFAATWTGRWVSAGVDNRAYIQCAIGSCPVATVNNPTINNNQVAGAFYMDIGASFNLTKPADGGQSQIYFKIDNLTNLDPPAAVTTGSNILSGVNSNLYDVLGRFYHIGLRFNN